MRHLSVAAVAAVFVLAGAGGASAQSNQEGTESIQFDFLNPGARSMAMGGAFIGLADDATAALANPAGLLKLPASEVSLEFRRRTFQSALANDGRVSGPLTNQGIDTVAGLRPVDATGAARNVSFASAAFVPNKWFAVTGYLHQTARFESAVDPKTQGFFLRSTATGVDARRRPFEGDSKLEIFDAGVAAAAPIWRSCKTIPGSTEKDCRPVLTAGGGVSFYWFDMNASVLRYTTPVGAPASDFYADKAAWSRQVNAQSLDGDDNGIGWKAGIMFTPVAAFSAGAVVKMNPDFSVTQNYQRFDLAAGVPASLAMENQFALPDVIGGGIAVKPISALTVSADVVRVYYSDQNFSLFDTFPVFDTATGSPLFFNPLNANEWKIENATEFHVGGEFKIPVGLAPVARVGFWNDPVHVLAWSPTDPNAANDTGYYTFGPGALPTKDVRHFTVGGGFAYKKLEINAAGDFSDRGNIGSLSAVVRFGRR